MRRQVAALCCKLAELLDASAVDARLIVGGSADAPGTYAIDVSWMVVGPSPWEELPGLYIDGERIPPEEPPSSDGKDMSDGTKGETDKP